MSFELSIPKTRKEYFMAIAAGGTPGTDFPARYEVAPVIEHVYYKYEETLTGGAATSGYAYSKGISDFVEPGGFTMVVKINGKETTHDLLTGRWTNADGYYLEYNERASAQYIVGITSETELSGSALDVVVETSWDDDSDTGTPLQPKTVEEAYYANLAQINVASALSKMQIKTRKDQYLNALINATD